MNDRSLVGGPTGIVINDESDVVSVNSASTTKKNIFAPVFEKKDRGNCRQMVDSQRDKESLFAIPLRMNRRQGLEFWFDHYPKLMFIIPVDLR